MNVEKLLSWPFRDIRHRYSRNDAILYALSIGIGQNPVEPEQLNYVYEKNLRPFATMPIVMGMVDDVGFLSDAEVGIDLPRMLHGQTGLRLHRPLPPEGEVISRLAIDQLLDRGPGKGALLCFSRTIREASSGDLAAEETGVFYLMGNGGFGGSNERLPPAAAIPERPCDLSDQLTTLPQAGLLYRLTGDRNPLHVDPAVASQAGFSRPILHGSCTYGVAGHLLVRLLCQYDSARLRRLDAKFKAPVYPGETLRVDVWLLGVGLAAFRVVAQERDLVVVDNGVCEFEEHS
ncbi:MAG: MaoC/PaaZ C-terminal domain-containing protein [Pigmentiphaga sp.]